MGDDCAGRKKVGLVGWMHTEELFEPGLRVTAPDVSPLSHDLHVRGAQGSHGSVVREPPSFVRTAEQQPATRPEDPHRFARGNGLIWNVLENVEHGYHVEDRVREREAGGVTGDEGHIWLPVRRLCRIRLVEIDVDHRGPWVQQPRETTLSTSDLENGGRTDGRNDAVDGPHLFLEKEPLSAGAGKRVVSQEGPSSGRCRGGSLVVPAADIGQLPGAQRESPMAESPDVAAYLCCRSWQLGSVLPTPDVVPRKADECASEVSRPAKSTVLCEQRSEVTLSIADHLRLETLHVRTVKMGDHRGRLVMDRVSRGQQAVPQFAVFAAPRFAGTKALIEATDLGKHVATERHVDPGADLPHRCAPSTRCVEPRVVVAPRQIALSEASYLKLEELLGFGVEDPGKGETGDRDSRTVRKGSGQLTDPRVVWLGIVVGERDDGSAGVAETLVARWHSIRGSAVSHSGPPHAGAPRPGSHRSPGRYRRRSSL